MRGRNSSLYDIPHSMNTYPAYDEPPLKHLHYLVEKIVVSFRKVSTESGDGSREARADCWE